MKWLFFKKRKWRLWAIAIVFLAGLILIEFLIPELYQTFNIYSKIQNNKEQIASVQNWEERLRSLNERQEKLENYFSDIYIDIPSNDQMSSVINEIISNIEEGGVALQQMQPESRIEHDSHFEIPIQIELNGSYHEVGRTLQFIEQSNYLMKINEVNIFHERSENDLRVLVHVSIILLKQANDA